MILDFHATPVNFARCDIGKPESAAHAFVALLMQADPAIPESRHGIVIREARAAARCSPLETGQILNHAFKVPI